MSCLKCGRDTNNDRFFCDECIASMKDYPVKPGTPVYLPPISREPAVKRVPHRPLPPNPEEQVAKLRKSNRRLRILSVLLTLLLALSCFLLFRWYQGDEPPITGRNYSIGSPRSPR